MCTKQQLSLEIYHPAFRSGYEYGRCLYFHKAMRLTDKYIVEGLLNIVNNPENQQNPNEMYYAIGFVFGLLSASVLPLQPGEEDGKAVEEAFLREVTEQHEGSGQQLAAFIQDYWDKRDLLAEKLDAPTFVQMLNRGKKLHLFMKEEGEE